MKSVLEICAGDIGSVEAAQRGGAQRVELCSALALGGLTPSQGFINAAVGVGVLRVHVLVRHREGDFVYSAAGLSAMLKDIEMVAHAGADGVVIGALCADGTVDVDACRQMVLMAKSHGLSVTFHRAFDRVCRPMEALEQVIALGCDYLLTSGCAESAIKGVEMLKRLQKAACGRIEIIAAAGINSDNVAEVMRRSGCRQVHASARHNVPSSMQYERSEVRMGASDAERERLTTDIEEVIKIVSQI